MAVTLKRKRGAVSYKEPSSDEEESSSSGQEHSSARKRAAPSRRSARRQHADDEASTQQAPLQASSPVKLVLRVSRTSRNSRTTRTGRPRISYKDASSDNDDDTDGDFETDMEEQPRAVRPKPRLATSRSPHKIRSSNRKTRAMSVLGAPLQPNLDAPVQHKVLKIPTDGIVPAWASLPYHVLLQIFVYASHPLHDENMKPTPSKSWLVHTALVCKTFTKPALTALYRNPPIFAVRQTRRDLVYHLITPPPDAYVDYRVMVKRLEVDVTQMSALTDVTHSVTDLAALVQSLTTLREIDIFDPMDRPPFRARSRRLRRWVYPKELFDALGQTELRLRSWRWNSTFCDRSPLWIKSVHGDIYFQSLRELTLTKFHPDPSREDGEDHYGQPTIEELLASALATLPNLKTLSFETCGVVSGRMLPLLPKNLVSLSITNCGELLSEPFQAFLATHGSQLEELVLNHNQALDLSFSVDLKRSCPKLEVFRMDATYYSSLEMSSDNEPLYDTLLGENEVPSWPSTLRIIDMQYLRKWNSTAATNFFRSLIDAAEDLPWLREITIIAMVDTDWRQRAVCRRKWSASFKWVFARRWVAPNPHLVSLRAFRESRENHESEDEVESLTTKAVMQQVNEIGSAKTIEDESDSDAPLVHSRKSDPKSDDKWGSKRLRSRATASYDEESEAEPEDESEDDASDSLFVQGRCHTVIFRIDNFRPREEIYAEADFLDAEPSGDEEWNGNEDNDEEGGYAW